MNVYIITKTVTLVSSPTDDRYPRKGFKYNPCIQNTINYISITIHIHTLVTDALDEATWPSTFLGSIGSVMCSPSPDWEWQKERAHIHSANTKTSRYYLFIPFALNTLYVTWWFTDIAVLSLVILLFIAAASICILICAFVFSLLPSTCTAILLNKTT